MNIKHFFLIVLLLPCFAYSQDINEDLITSKYSRQGKFYTYWGWNISTYSKSDMKFEGNDFDFTLHEVIAKDRPTKFSAEKYLNILNITVPQYNFRFGYFIKPNLDISIGIDHMKYVVQNNQNVLIEGSITSGSRHDGEYLNEEKSIDYDFLRYEHTDGLNYVNIELRRTDDLLNYKNISISIIEGLSGGLLIPKSDVTLLNNERKDQFHLAGYGLGLVAGLNFTFYQHFFIQTEVKAGYINLPNVRITNDSSERASHDFNFGQLNVVFGSKIDWDRNKKKLRDLKQ